MFPHIHPLLEGGFAVGEVGGREIEALKLRGDAPCAIDADFDVGGGGQEVVVDHPAAIHDGIFGDEHVGDEGGGVLVVPPHAGQGAEVVAVFPLAQTGEVTGLHGDETAILKLGASSLAQAASR